MVDKKDLITLPAVKTVYNFISNRIQMSSIDEFMMKVAIQQSHKISEPIVRLFYKFQKQEVPSEYVYQHPELYPTSDQITEFEQSLKSITHPGKVSHLYITDEGVYSQPNVIQLD